MKEPQIDIIKKIACFRDVYSRNIIMELKMGQILGTLRVGLTSNVKYQDKDYF